MSKSRETFNKKEKEKLRLKKKKEKEEKKEARKSNETADYEDMIAYVDEDGNITSTPPDPTKKRKIDVESIQIGTSKQVEGEDDGAPKTGKVTFFNESKGYGFIKDDQTQESLFVHFKSCIDPIKENDKVTYDTEKTPKGLSAIEVKLVK